METFTTTAL